ncbi:MAG TPA: hypothetical protein VLH79_15340 [Chthonomonadales bacterium]|nr:hypothetical protein [Chthonomonadales bacterium]
MRRLVMSLLAAASLMALVPAQAAIISYTVHTGTGFDVPVSDCSGSTNPVVGAEPLSGFQRPGPGQSADMGGITRVPGEDVVAGSGGKANHVRTHAIRSFLSFDPTDEWAEGANHIASTPSMILIASRTKAGVATTTMNSVALAPPGPRYPRDFTRDLVPIVLQFDTYDHAGAPRFPSGPGRTSGNDKDVGARSDMATSPDPEPGAYALLIGAAVPLTLFSMRFRHRRKAGARA